MPTTSTFRLSAKVRGSYLECIAEFPLTAISSDEHLTAAQEQIDRLLALPKLDSGQQLYLDALSDLVEIYEDEHHRIPPASDADMLRHLLGARGVTQVELHHSTGISKSSISEILAGKKPFSRQMIRKLADFFGVDATMLTANF